VLGSTPVNNGQTVFRPPFFGTNKPLYCKAKTYELTYDDSDLPTHYGFKLDDDFAKAIGFDTLALLQAKIQENMGLEAKQKADEAAEIELLEKLVDSSTFSDVPEMLVSQEVNRMIQELQSGIDEQGMKWEDYLSSIKKTTDQLKQDFLAPAVRRIKTAVLIKHFAKEQQIEVTKEELDQEQDRLLKGIKPSDTESRLRVASPEFRDYMTVQLRNRKTLEWLKKECIQE
jgi:trigger factor